MLHQRQRGHIVREERKEVRQSEVGKWAIAVEGLEDTELHHEYHGSPSEQRGKRWVGQLEDTSQNAA